MAEKQPVEQSRKTGSTRSSDRLWLRILDLAAALQARSYDASGQLVLEVTDAMCPWNEGRWHLGGGSPPGI